jgi:hypothetical protein
MCVCVCVCVCYVCVCVCDVCVMCVCDVCVCVMCVCDVCVCVCVCAKVNRACTQASKSEPQTHLVVELSALILQHADDFLVKLGALLQIFDAGVRRVELTRVCNRRHGP